MRRRFTARASAGWVVLVAIVGLGIWTSRPIVNQNPQIGTIRYERLLGRIVAIEVDSDGDGRPESLARFRWREPYDPNIYTYNGPYCADVGRHFEDRDRDGRWDTWFHSISEVGEGDCVYSFEADTNGDGQPDWFQESADGIGIFAQLVELRGF